MDPAALAARIEAIDGRLAGTDAERRAAAACAAELRASGRRPRTQTLWFRPQRMVPRAIESAAAVAGSIVSASHPTGGFGIAAGALVVAALEAAGVPVLALLVARRATQNVVAASPSADARAHAAGGRGSDLLLVLAANVDAPRDSVLDRFERRLRARVPARGRASLVPGALGVHLLTLVAITAFAGARVAGAEGVVLGAAQLIPSTVAILLVGAFLEAGTTGPMRAAPAGGPAVAATITRALDAAPPRHLDVEVLIAGAGAAGAPGMRGYVRPRRRALAAEQVIVLELGSAAGPVRAIVRDGEIIGTALHPRLAELATEVAGPRAAGQGRRLSAARVARGAGWPALAVEGEPRALAAVALRLIAKVDAEVGARTGSAG